MRFPSTAAFVVSISFALSGCASAVIGGAAVTGVAAYQERGVGGAANDTRLEAAIVNEWFQYDHTLPTKVSAEVYNARVLLTGAVTDKQVTADAVRLAYKVDGVQNVINEVQQVPATDFLDTARDTWISTRLRAAITFDSDIYAINYALETVNGVVYLIGTAQSADELARVTAHANALDYVHKVVSHVTIKAAPDTPPPAAASPEPRS